MDPTVKWSVRKHAVFAKYRFVETTAASYYVLSDSTLKIKFIYQFVKDLSNITGLKFLSTSCWFC